MTDAATTTPLTRTKRVPLDVRLGLAIERLRRLSATGKSESVRGAAAAGAARLEQLRADPSLIGSGVVRRYVRATNPAEVSFASHIALYFGINIDEPENGQLHGMDWVGHPDLIDHATVVAREFLSEFHWELHRHATDYLERVLPLDPPGAEN